MKIAVGWDHHGRRFKDSVSRILADLGHEMIDLGSQSDESSDYPDFAFQVGEAVSGNKAERGLLLCGSGIGMCIAANKVPGVRAGLVSNEETARLSRAHNNTNILCLSDQTAQQEPLMRKLIEIWLATPFDGGRHERRVNKISRYEKDRNS